MPNNLQLGYHRSPSCEPCPLDHVNFLFFIHKVSLHLPKDYPIQIGTHSSLEPLNLQNVQAVISHSQLNYWISQLCVNTNRYIQVRSQACTILKNLTAWGTLHIAICQILFLQRQLSRQFAKFSYHQSFPPYGSFSLSIPIPFLKIAKISGLSIQSLQFFHAHLVGCVWQVKCGYFNYCQLSA